MDLIKETEQLIRELNRMLKLTWFYSPTHSTVKNTLQIVQNQLQTMTPSDSYLLFNVSGDNLLLGALPLSTKDENVRSFIKQLKKRRINSILFYPGVGLQELEGLITVLALDPKLLRKQGGIKPALTSREITHIDVTEYQYQAGEVGSGVIEEETSFAVLETTPERISHIIQYLQGTISELDSIESQLFAEILNDPMRSAELQAQAVQRMVPAESTAPVPELAMLTRDVLVRIQQYLTNCQEEERIKLQRKVALSILHQDPTVALYTVATRNDGNINHVEAVKKMLDRLDDTELINLVTAGESDQHRDLEKVSSLFFELPLEKQRIDELMNKYTDLLVKRREVDQNEAEFTSLQQELNKYPPSSMLSHTTTILLEMLEKKENIDSIIEILQALQTGTTQLFELHEFSGLYDVYRSIFQLTHAESPETKLIEKEEILQKLREFYSWLTNAQIINKLINALDTIDSSGANISPVSFEIDNGQLSNNTIVNQKIMILEILTFIGNPAIPVILEKINKLSVGNPIYQSLKLLLVRFGDASIPFIESIFYSESEKVQEQLIVILGQIGTAQAKTALLNMLPKLSPALYKQVMQVISQFSDEQTLSWLLDILHHEKDTEIKLTALEGIARFNNKEAIEFLISFVTTLSGTKKNRILQQRIIQLFGKNKIIESVPFLIKLFQQQSWFLPKRIEPIRIAAAQSLAQIGTAEAIAVVRNGCQDKRKEVRTMCQTLIK